MNYYVSKNRDGIIHSVSIFSDGIDFPSLFLETE